MPGPKAATRCRRPRYAACSMRSSPASVRSSGPCDALRCSARRLRPGWSLSARDPPPAPARRASPTWFLRRTTGDRAPGCAWRPALRSADGRHPADPSRLVHMPLPLSPHPLSEQKVFRGLIIDIVDEKIRRGSCWIPGSYTLCTGLKHLILNGFCQRCRIGRDPRVKTVKTTCYAKLDQLRPWNPI